MKLSKNTTILIVALVVTIGVAGIVLFNATRTDPAVITETEGSSESEMVFINLASQIDAIHFSTDLLNDPRFLILEDIRVAVIPENAGRKDPFAIIGR